MTNTLIKQIQNLGDELYLLKGSIGPVQEYISEARKTRDLYIGSNLLSQATKKTIEPIRINPNFGNIIYPYLDDSGTCLNSIPNMFMAVIQKEKFYDLIEQMESALHKFWNDAGKEVLIRLPDYCNLEYQWNYQINNHFYLNWVAIPVTNKELMDSYKDKLNDIQNFFDDRKLTRNFNAWQGTCVEKCVQCGHREIMPKQLFINLRNNREFKNRIKINERLCAICLLKRLLNASFIEKLEPEFESVVDVSAQSFKLEKKLSENKSKKKEFIREINKFKKKFLKETDVDSIEQLNGEWFYKDNLRFNFLKKKHEINNNDGLKNNSKEMQNALENLYNQVGKEPSKYYVIVSMDGDNMGKLMSGDFINKNEKFSLDYHYELSKILAKTGTNILKLIEDHKKGYCVYSGGDDFLAFLPLENALCVLNKARETFSSGFSSLGKRQTSSAGIVILHYHDPLQRGLIEARNNVEKAKDWFKTKDAFALTLRVSSGAKVTWYSKWTINSSIMYGENSEINVGQIPILDILEYFVSFMTMDVNNRLSPEFVHELLEELPAFYEYNEKNNNKFEWIFNDQMFKLEFSRLLKRHIRSESIIWKYRYGGQVTTIKLLTDLFSFMADPDKNSQTEKEFKIYTKDNFEHFLQISLFLAREQRQRFD